MRTSSLPRPRLVAALALVAVLATGVAACGDDDEEAQPEPVTITGTVVQVTSARVFVVEPDGGDPVTVFNAEGEPEPEVGDTVVVEGTHGDLGAVVRDDEFNPEADQFLPGNELEEGITADSVEIVGQE